jgi:hypothetical protein
MARLRKFIVNEKKDNLYMADPQPTLDPQAIEVGGARAKDDGDQCLYVGTPWEGDVIIDCRDVDDFKEVSHTIGCTLSVRTWALILQSLSLISSILQALKSKSIFLCCSRWPRELKLGRAC